MLDIKQSRDHVAKRRICFSYIILFVICFSGSVSLSSQGTAFACRQTSGQTTLSFMNQGPGHLFDQEHQGRLISIKFRPILYMEPIFCHVLEEKTFILIISARMMMMMKPNSNFILNWVFSYQVIRNFDIFRFFIKQLSLSTFL